MNSTKVLFSPEDIQLPLGKGTQSSPNQPEVPIAKPKQHQKPKQTALPHSHLPISMNYSGPNPNRISPHCPHSETLKPCKFPTPSQLGAAIFTLPIPMAAHRLRLAVPGNLPSWSKQPTHRLHGFPSSPENRASKVNPESHLYSFFSTKPTHTAFTAAHPK